MDAAGGSRELRDAVAHAGRLALVLAELEDEIAGCWITGRASELRAVVACALAAWRAGGSEAKAVEAIGSHASALHRGIARRLRFGAPLRCCTTEDPITRALFGDVIEVGVVDRIDEGERSTDPVPRKDSPEVLARLHAELGRVDALARGMLRRLGRRCVTLDDLVGFGREGLLDAARSYDDRRGIPFARWATLRIRGAIVDGVRRSGGASRRVMRELQAMEEAQAVDLPRGSAGNGSSREQQPGDGEPGVRLADTALALRPAHEGIADGGELGQSPEDIVARSELYALLRGTVDRLPEPDRQLVEAHYFAGRSLAQVAATAGETERWARSVHARALAAIRDALGLPEGVPIVDPRTDGSP